MNTTNSNTLALRESAPAQLNVTDLMTMARQVAASGLFAVKTAEQAFSLMMLCQAENLHPIQAMRRYHILNGRPTMRADAIQAEFQRRGGHIEFHARTDTECTATFTHPSASAVRVDWTMARAKTAGLLTNPTWQKYSRAMLHARCVSEGVRAVLPEVVVGIYTPEEAQEFDLPRPPRARQSSNVPSGANVPADLGQSNAEAEYRGQSEGDDAPDLAAADWEQTRVHFGKNRGLMLSELTGNQLHWYENEWMPKKENSPDVTGDDIALIEAIKGWRQEREVAKAEKKGKPAKDVLQPATEAELLPAADEEIPM